MQEARREEVEVLLRRFKVGEDVRVLLRVLKAVQRQFREPWWDEGTEETESVHDLRYRHYITTVKSSHRVCGPRDP